MNLRDVLLLCAVAAIFTYLPAIELLKLHRKPSIVRILAWPVLALAMFALPGVHVVLVPALTYYRDLVAPFSIVATCSNVAGVLLGIALMMCKQGGTMRRDSLAVALPAALLLACLVGATADELGRQPSAVVMKDWSPAARPSESAPFDVRTLLVRDEQYGIDRDLCVDGNSVPLQLAVGTGDFFYGRRAANQAWRIYGATLLIDCNRNLRGWVEFPDQLRELSPNGAVRPSYERFAVLAQVTFPDGVGNATLVRRRWETTDGRPAWGLIDVRPAGLDTPFPPLNPPHNA